jgi:hypothetical protein
MNDHGWPSTLEEVDRNLEDARNRLERAGMTLKGAKQIGSHQERQDAREEVRLAERYIQLLEEHRTKILKEQVSTT